MKAILLFVLFTISVFCIITSNAEICSTFHATGICGASGGYVGNCGKVSENNCKGILGAESRCDRADDIIQESNNLIDWSCQYVNDPGKYCYPVIYNDCYSVQNYICYENPLGTCYVEVSMEGGVEVIVSASTTATTGSARNARACEMKATGFPYDSGERTWAEGN